jgi:hypothetical protein
MMPEQGRIRIDPLHVFAIAVAACLAAFLFLLAVLNNVSSSTAAGRAIFGWVVLSLLGMGIGMLIRWVLAAPPPRN